MGRVDCGSRPELDRLAFVEQILVEDANCVD